VYHTENTQETNRKNTGDREALKSRGKGTRREALLEGDKVQRLPPWRGVLISLRG